MRSALLSLHSPPLLCSRLSTPPKTLNLTVSLNSIFPLRLHERHLRRDLSVAAGDDGYDFPGDDFPGADYFDDEIEIEDADNEPDYEIDYDYQLIDGTKVETGEEMVALAPLSSGGFVSTVEWEAETMVDYRINEEEFHKISLLDCDFFIRKSPDSDDDVYDFREVEYSIFLFYNA